MPPPGLLDAMELQAEAERRNRAGVLRSEGLRQAKINESEPRRVRHPHSSLSPVFLLQCLNLAAIRT